MENPGVRRPTQKYVCDELNLFVNYHIALPVDCVVLFITLYDCQLYRCVVDTV